MVVEKLKMNYRVLNVKKYVIVVYDYQQKKKKKIPHSFLVTPKVMIYLAGNSFGQSTGKISFKLVIFHIKTYHP